MKTPFFKFQAAGNDFILVDEFKGFKVLPEEKESFVARICDRHFGVGSDGAIFVQSSGEFDAKFVFYNPDGSVAEMCGNGMRCFAKYVFEHGIARKEKISVESLKGVIVAEPKASDGRVEEVRVDMGSPYLTRSEIPVSGSPGSDFIDQEVKIEKAAYRITAVGMGNPHAVLFVQDAGKVDVKAVGSSIRHRTELFPNGTNVHFVESLGGNEFMIRTYERGVEDETLACGTGICASAVAAALNGLAEKRKPLVFHAIGGKLTVEFVLSGEKIDKIYLTGPVKQVFMGEYENEK